MWRCDGDRYGEAMDPNMGESLIESNQNSRLIQMSPEYLCDQPERKNSVVASLECW
jgi:hypothetical protein